MHEIADGHWKGFESEDIDIIIDLVNIIEILYLPAGFLSSNCGLNNNWKMKEYFKGKVVFITGSSKGIGKATAELLGSYGARICLNGRNIESLRKTYTELKAKNIDCMQIAGDVSDGEVCFRMIRKIVEHYGRLDILINNAGISTQGMIRDLTQEAWDRAIGINTMGSVYTTHHALPYLLQSRGTVIFISSLAGKVGMPGHSTYSVSKMGLTALARAMQIEFSKKELHTGIIYVGFTENEPDKKILYPDGKYRQILSRSQKTAKREEVALSIARAIYKKKKVLTLTAVGKLQAVCLRLCPFVVYMILKKANRDFPKLYG